jgi:PIN domain nuclease of toxin-antitoxin system
MKALLDTHVLIWAAGFPERLSADARVVLVDPANELLFSAASLWEVAIKSALGRSDFSLDARLLRRELLDNGYGELPVTGEHAVMVGSLPPIHKDPFDRLLVAQATAEGVTLLTSDEIVGRYPGPIRRV